MKARSAKEEKTSLVPSWRRVLHDIYLFIVRTAVIIVAATLILVPILVKRSVSSDPSAVVVVPADEVPAEATRAFDDVLPTMNELGFEPVVWLRTDMTPGTVTFLGLMLNAERDAAFSTMNVFNQRSDDLGEILVYSKSYGEFVSRLTDDREVRTLNLSWAKAFDPEDHVIENRHPALAGRLEDLYQRHRGHVAGPDVPVLPFAENADFVAEVVRSGRRSMDVQVDKGLMYRDEDGVYRLTWKGAFVMTWRQALG